MHERMEASTIFKARTRMLDVKNNPRGNTMILNAANAQKT